MDPAPLTDRDRELAALRARIAKLEERQQRSRVFEEQAALREHALRRQYHALVRLSRSRALERGDRRSAFPEITRIAADVLEVEQVGIWLYNDDHSRIRCVCQYQRGLDSHVDGAELTADDYPAYFGALEQGRSLAAGRAVADPRTRELSASYLLPLGISSMLDAPIRLGRRPLGVICHEHVGPPRDWSAEDEAFAGSMADYVAIVIQVQERRRAEASARRSERQLRRTMAMLQRSSEDLEQVMASVSDYLWSAVIGPSGEFTYRYYSPVVERITGRPPEFYLSGPHRWLSTVHPDDRERVGRISKGLATTSVDRVAAEYRIVLPDSGICWVRDSVMVRRLADDRIRVDGVVSDITERKESQERQALMMRELDHRVKNNLAVVISIAEQTAERAASIEAFNTSFLGRLRSLSIVHEMLARQHWKGADLRDTVERIVAPYAGGRRGRLTLSGESSTLPIPVATSLGLVIHELATNAAKHGSLSVPEGRVDLAWRLDPADGPGIRMTWKEDGGPAVRPPTDRGLGLELIEQLVSRQLGGRVDLAFETSGLRCDLEVPASG